MTSQLSLFAQEQSELPGVEQNAAVYRADPDEVRAELLRVLAQARAAQNFRGMRAGQSTGVWSFPNDELAARRGGRAIAL